MVIRPSSFVSSSSNQALTYRIFHGRSPDGGPAAHRCPRQSRGHVRARRSSGGVRDLSNPLDQIVISACSCHPDEQAEPGDGTADDKGVHLSQSSSSRRRHPSPRRAPSARTPRSCRSGALPTSSVASVPHCRTGKSSPSTARRAPPRGGDRRVRAGEFHDHHAVEDKRPSRTTEPPIRQSRQPELTEAGQGLERKARPLPVLIDVRLDVCFREVPYSVQELLLVVVEQ